MLQAQTMATASRVNAETFTTENINRSVPNSDNYPASQINGTGDNKKSSGKSIFKVAKHHSLGTQNDKRVTFNLSGIILCIVTHQLIYPLPQEGII